MEPSPGVEQYYSSRQIKWATALVIRKLGLREKLAAAESENSDDPVVMDKEEGVGEIEAEKSSQTPFLVGEDQCESEEEILGQIFNTPDVLSLPVSEEDQTVEEAEFFRCVVLLKGLVGMVDQSSKSAEDGKVILSSAMDSERVHPVFTVFKFVSQEFSEGLDRVEMSFGWMKESVESVCQLLNTDLDHLFLKDSLDICQEFVNFSLECLSQLNCEEIQYKLVLLVSSLAQAKDLGLLLVRLLLGRLLQISDKLREAEQFGYTDTASLQMFGLVMNLALELWPHYLACLFPKPASKRKEAPGGRRRGSGGELGKPKLSLSETTELVEEVVEWRTILESCTEGLSIVQPEFCEAVWKLDSFCQGLLDKLGRVL